MLECQMSFEKEDFYKCKKMLDIVGTDDYTVHITQCKMCQKDEDMFKRFLKYYLLNKSVRKGITLKEKGLSRRYLVYEDYKQALLQFHAFQGTNKKRIGEIIDVIDRSEFSDLFKELFENLDEEAYLYFKKELERRYKNDKEDCKKYLIALAETGYISKDYIMKFVKEFGLDKE